jgi:hypothetical protein
MKVTKSTKEEKMISKAERFSNAFSVLRVLRALRGGIVFSRLFGKLQSGKPKHFARCVNFEA